MGAISSYMRHNHPDLTVHYTTAERFTSEFVTALRTHGPERFKQRYRGLDALLIDDVQFLEGKEKTEEEFVHTFNALFAAGKQIVLSSDRPPGSLVRLEERLRDRFAWGLTVEIDPPDLRTRVALLWRFASDAVDQLPEPDVLREIANRAPGNVRRLEGALTRVLARLLRLRRAPRRRRDRPGPRLEDRRHAELAPGSVVAPSVARSRTRSHPCSASRAPIFSPPSARRPSCGRATSRCSSPASSRRSRSFRSPVTSTATTRPSSTPSVSSASKNEPGSETAGDIHSVRAVLGESLPLPIPRSDPNTPGSRPQD